MFLFYLQIFYIYKSKNNLFTAFKALWFKNLYSPEPTVLFGIIFNQGFILLIQCLLKNVYIFSGY